MKGIKLYVLRSGIITDMPREMWIQAGAPVDPDDVVEFPVLSFVVKHPEGILLYDAGHSREERYFKPKPEKKRPAWTVPEEGKLPNQLSRLGIDPEKVDYVVCSHLHIDHTGYLEIFKTAEIIVSDAEFTHAAKMYALGKLDYPYVKADFEQWLNSKLNWRLVPQTEDEILLLEGIKIFNFGPSHSYGMLGLLVELEEKGNILLVSDAIYSKENMGPPIRLPGFIVDNDGYTRTVERIKELAEKYNAEIWFGHDMEQFKRFVLMEDGYYS